MLRIILFTSLVVLLAAQVPRSAMAESPTAELQGTYDGSGTDADGTGYRTTVRIEKRGDVYYLQWQFPSGPTAVGIGILDGNVLAVSYYGTSVGVVLYRIDGTTLDGHWTDAGMPSADPGLHRERFLLDRQTELVDPRTLARGARRA